MRADLGDASPLERDDPVGLSDGRQTMGNDDERATCRHELQVALDDGFALSVQGGGRLIEDQDLGIDRERAGDGDALALATRQVARRARRCACRRPRAAPG